MLRDSRRNRFLVLLVVAVLAITSCNQGETTKGTPTAVVTTSPATPIGSATVVPPEGTALPAGLVKWQTRLGDYTVERGLVVSEGTAYVVTQHYDHENFKNLSPCLCAIDVQTGAKKWAFTYVGSAASAPTVSNGLVFFSVSEPMLDVPNNSIIHFYAVDATTGKEKWHFNHQTGGVEAAQPLVEGDIVYFTSLRDRHEMYDTTGIIHGEPNIHALRAETGELLWKVKTKADTWPAAAIDKGILYFVEQIKYTDIVDEFYIKALDLSTRNTKWQYTVSGQYHPDVDKLIIANNMVYVSYTRYGNTISALDAETREVRWTYTADSQPVPGTSTPTGSCCLFSLSKARKPAPEAAYSIQASAVYTSYAPPLPGLKTLPEVAGDTLVIGLGVRQGTPEAREAWGDMDGYMLGLDAITGKERWRTSVHRVLNSWPALIVRKEIAYLVAVTADAPWGQSGPSTLYALDTKSGRILWEKSMDGLPGPRSASIDGNLMIAASWQGEVYAIELPGPTP